jgi:predicted adenylyl cyclase CyaB
MMNFKRFITIDKERFVYRLDDVKFCFDTIKDFGDGLEIEKMAAEDFHLVHEELEKLAQEIGLGEKDRPENSFTYEAIKKLARF